MYVFILNLALHKDNTFLTQDTSEISVEDTSYNIAGGS